MCRNHAYGKMMRRAKQRNDLQWLIHIRPDTCLRLKFLHLQDRISLFNWLIFLMKRASHFATKLSSRDIQNCNCFWVPSYDLDPPNQKFPDLPLTLTGLFIFNT